MDLDSTSRPSTMWNWTNWDGSCREQTLLRDDLLSKVKGWVRENTKIGPASEVAVSYHQGRYGIEILIESLFGDGTRSWVMFVKGIKKIRDGNYIGYTGECIGKLARPKQTSIRTTSSSTSTLPYHQREWIDVEQGPFDELFRSVKKDDQIASTRSFSSSRRRRSSRIQNVDTDVSFRVYVFSPVRWRRKSTKCSHKSQSCHYSCREYPGSKIVPKRFPIQLPRMMRKITNIEKCVAALQPVFTTL